MIGMIQMKILKKILTITAITIVVTIILRNNYSIATAINTNYYQRLPVRVALFAKDLNDDYLVSLRNRFEEIQKNYCWPCSDYGQKNV